jgi:Helix-turn-helix domain
MVQIAQKALAGKALALKQSAPQKRGFSVEQFCEIYDVGRSTAYNEIRAGRLKARKVGKRTIIGDEDAEDWFSQLPRVKAAAA